MTGIGITNWRDHGLTSCYPLMINIEPNDLFVDASFVQFDNFIPQLSTVEVTAEGIVFTFLLDDGVFVYQLDAADCVDGTIISLRGITDRAYGQIVCGPGVATIFNNDKGRIVTLNVSFEPSVVRSIPSTAGLFSLQGSNGNVKVTTDINQRFIWQSPNGVEWNTVAQPSNIQRYELKSNLLYSVTDRKQIVEIDPSAKSITPLFEIPIACTAILATSTKLIGALGSSLYDLTNLPPKLITTLTTTDEPIQALASKTDAILYMLTTNHVVVVNIATPSETLYTAKPASNGILTLTTTNILFTGTGIGQSNNQFYSLEFATPPTITTKNIFNLASHIAGVTKINNTIYATYTREDNNCICSLNSSTYTGTEIFSEEINTTTGTLQSLTVGTDLYVTVKPVIALETINGMPPINNTFQINSNGLIQIQKTRPNELTVSLATDIANTKIKRTINYQ